MKKARLALCVFVFLFGLFASSAQAATIFDDFNDGNLDGWEILGSHKDPSDFGNWHVENGVLVHDWGGDGFIALLDNLSFSSQTVETQIKFVGPAGYGGFWIWFQDYDNNVVVNVYPASGGIRLTEWENRVERSSFYPYSINYNDDLWYNLKVEADSGSGILRVYMNGEHIITHQTTTPNRMGQTGYMAGNSGGYFDDFKLSSIDAPPFIDIKPGDSTNTINIKKAKSIPVAILSSQNFSALTQVDRTSLTFGKLGNEESLLSCSRKDKDVNGDGLLDLVCNFSRIESGFQCGDTQGILKGKFNVTGMSFEETQAIRVAPCK
jgi:hypothetical protein